MQKKHEHAAGAFPFGRSSPAPPLFVCDSVKCVFFHLHALWLADLLVSVCVLRAVCPLVCLHAASACA